MINDRNTLELITHAAQALKEVDKQADSLEAELKAMKERSRILREETIPGVMLELGLDEIKLSTGEKVSIKQDVYASIPEERKEECYTWLVDNSFGGIVKMIVGVQFSKGEQEKALELYQSLMEQDLPAMMKQDVHAQTMKAFLREQLAKGTDIPLDLFGARPVWTAKVK